MPTSLDYSFSSCVKNTDEMIRFFELISFEKILYFDGIKFFVFYYSLKERTYKERKNTIYLLLSQIIRQ